jgi:nitrogen regulatory protein P-II 2
MKTEPMKLLTVIAEAVLEDRLVADLIRLGAKGYSVAGAHGSGASGPGASDWEGGNVRIESLLAPEAADRILEHLAQEYFPIYGVVAYTTDVRVVRGAKYR